MGLELDEWPTIQTDTPLGLIEYSIQKDTVNGSPDTVLRLRYRKGRKRYEGAAILPKDGAEDVLDIVRALATSWSIHLEHTLTQS